MGFGRLGALSEQPYAIPRDLNRYRTVQLLQGEAVVGLGERSQVARVVKSSTGAHILVPYKTGHQKVVSRRTFLNLNLQSPTEWPDALQLQYTTRLIVPTELLTPNFRRRWRHQRTTTIANPSNKPRTTRLG